MSLIGTVESLWRYPVKSMRGEEPDELFAGYAGVYGDRLFAFRSSATRNGLPYLTAREKPDLLRYRPHFRHADKAARPANLEDAQKLGANPVSADPTDLIVDVETPDGKTLAIDDPHLLALLGADLDGEHQLKLFRSDRAMTDARPLSVFSVQTARELATETGLAIDKRRFRANVYLNLTSERGFGEDQFVGRCLRIGAKVIVSILDRDSRCAIITMDPDTAERTPAILRQVAQAHEGKAGVYGAVLIEGIIRTGDLVELLN